MISIITTTVSRKKDAIELGKMLLDHKLIVCANITEVTSQYYWKGRYHEELEYQVSFKTRIEKKSQAIKCIKQNHPYEIPLIASKEFEISNSYKVWMDGELT